MPSFRFRPLALVLALMAVVALPGCAKRETRVESGDRTQTLHYGVLAEPNDLDPALVDDIDTGFVVGALMEGLAQYDARTGLPNPAGAERWEVSPDNLTWTFHLRPGARWSNGDPVTARDYVYAEKRMLSPGFAAVRRCFLLKNGKMPAGKVADFSRVSARAADDPHAGPAIGEAAALPAAAAMPGFRF